MIGKVTLALNAFRELGDLVVASFESEAQVHVVPQLCKDILSDALKLDGNKICGLASSELPRAGFFE